MEVLHALGVALDVLVNVEQALLEAHAKTTAHLAVLVLAVNALVVLVVVLVVVVLVVLVPVVALVLAVGVLDAPVDVLLVLDALAVVDVQDLAQDVLIPVMGVAQVVHHHAKDVLVHVLVHALVVALAVHHALVTVVLLAVLPVQAHVLE